MAATPREQLIAEWRERLRDCESATGEMTSRSAWLTRVRVRLYRFLLSLYGTGEWQGAPGENLPSSGVGESPTAALQAQEAAPLAGKPAKSEGQIRSVLAAVSGASAQVPAPGPLVSEAEQNIWVIAATTKEKWQALAGLELLQQRGFQVRLRRRGNESILEVPARERKRAFELLDEWRQEMRALATSTDVRRGDDHASILPVIFGLMSFFCLLFFIVVTGCAFLFVWERLHYLGISSSRAQGASLGFETLFGPEYIFVWTEYVFVWLGVMLIGVAALIAATLRWWRIRKRPLANRHSESG